LQELPLRFDSQSDGGTTLQLAPEYRLSLYDAVYLELAIRRHLPLLTVDARLEEAAKALCFSLPQRLRAQPPGRPQSSRICLLLLIDPSQQS
jgi:hypothetical protein